MSDVAARVRALETLLVEKGYVEPLALDAIVETYETQGRAAQRRPRRRARLERPGLSRAAAGRRDLGDRRARLFRPSGRAHGRGREHAGAAQSRRLHPVLLLPLAGARPAAGLVQVAALSLARGDRSARRARRIRRRAAARDARSGSGIRPPRSAISSSPNAPRAPRRCVCRCR